MSASNFYFDGTSIALDLADLTKHEIIHAAQPLKFRGASLRSRQSIFEEISKLRPEDQARIKESAAAKRWSCPGSCLTETKRGPVEDACCGVDPNFLRAQREDVVKSCISKFIDRTNNDALSTVTCIVCAREVVTSAAVNMSIDDIPNRQLLTPSEPHPAHVLTNGVLLHVDAIKRTGCDSRGFLCHECGSRLQKNQLPRLSLANGMWIGDVPFELSVLSLGEKLLIAKYLPSAYIVKLFPMGKGGKSVNKGLRGNVSTYRLNMDDIADMVTDNLFPRPAALLASVIGVTIVGPKNVPEKSLPNILQVRRHRVHAALVWLVGNNPFYADITISPDRLKQLPEDGIPEEILFGVRYSDDVDLVERERASYVPEDMDVDDDDNGVGVDAGGMSTYKVCAKRRFWN